MLAVVTFDGSAIGNSLNLFTVGTIDKILSGVGACPAGTLNRINGSRIESHTNLILISQLQSK